MEWLLDNYEFVFYVVSVIIVVGLYARHRWWHDGDQLNRDLERLLTEGLDFLKGWAGEQAGNVTQEQVWRVADDIYLRYIEGTPLARFVDQARVRGALWGLFTRWRDEFTAEAFALPAKV